MSKRQTTEADLFRLELLYRQYAEKLRTSNPESMLADPRLSAEVKSDVRWLRSFAAALDMGANILQGLQGAGWERLAPEVRDGFIRTLAEFDAQRSHGKTDSPAEVAA